jgi:probable HAF family extracellular repeat protein
MRVFLRKKIVCRIVEAEFLLAMFLIPHKVTARGSYAITDLGTLGGSQSAANGINNHGDVVGSANVNSSGTLTNHAFLCSNGTLTDLGTLGDYVGGLSPVSSSAAFALNKNGQIVGFSYTSSGAIHAFLYDQGQMTDLGVLPGAQQSKAHSINDSGQIVGWSVPAGPQHAFLYDGAGLNDLGTLGGTESFAYCINNHGQIVGDSWLTNSGLSDTAFVYSNGVMSALGNLGNLPTIEALAINDNGQIVGYAGNSAGTISRGFLCSGGQMTDIGNLGGQVTNVIPAAINIHGQVVGTASGNVGPIRAFVYSSGVMLDLNDLIDADSGWTLFHANSINDNGQIVGSGQNPSFRTHAFLLTPRPSLRNLRINNGQAQFDLSGMTGVTYRVEYAPSLPVTNWVLLTNVAMASSPTSVSDSGNASGQRFYRARQL